MSKITSDIKKLQGLVDTGISAEVDELHTAAQRQYLGSQRLSY